MIAAGSRALAKVFEPLLPEEDGPWDVRWIDPEVNATRRTWRFLGGPLPPTLLIASCDSVGAGFRRCGIQFPDAPRDRRKLMAHVKSRLEAIRRVLAIDATWRRGVEQLEDYEVQV